MKMQIPPVGMKHGVLSVFRAIFRVETRKEKQYSHIINNIENQWYFFNAGKSALLFILNMLKQKKDGKNEVIMPAYTCYSVAAAIAEANLKIKICDINPNTLDYNYDELEQLVCNKTLCVIVTQLFGMRTDYSELKKIIQNKTVYIIEDAAQCEPKLNNNENGQDFIIYSLGRGKPLSVMGGGVLACHNAIFNKLIRQKYLLLPESSFFYEIKKLIEIFVNDIFLEPYLFWIPYNIKYLNLGKTIYPENIKISKLTKFQKHLFFHQIDRMQHISSSRRKVSEYYKKELKGKYIEKFIETDVASVRFPVYLKRDIAELSECEISELRKLGITSMYPDTINHLRNIKEYHINHGVEFKGSEWIVHHLLTLPTHEYIEEGVQKKIVSTLMDIDSE